MVVKKVLSVALQHNLDGVNIDFEEVIQKGSPDRSYLTLMVGELAQAFHSRINGSQVIRIMCSNSVILSFMEIEGKVKSTYTLYYNNINPKKKGVIIITGESERGQT